MRLAVISDIHGNLSALQAVLDHIERLDPEVERVVCAGDIVGHGPHPNEVIEVLRREQIETVMGNYDDAVAHTRIGSGVDFPDAASEDTDDRALRWTRRTLQPENMAYLHSLPRDLRLFPLGSRVGVKRNEQKNAATTEGRSLLVQTLLGSLYRRRPSRVRRVLLVHGSTRALNERIAFDTAQSILQALARHAQFDVLISSHTREPFQREHNGLHFVGVGPLSGPGARLGRAEFAVVDVGEGVHVEFPEVSYDPYEHLAALASSGLRASLN